MTWVAVLFDFKGEAPLMGMWLREIAVFVAASLWFAPCFAEEKGGGTHVADDVYLEFIRAVAKQTAQAQTQDPDAVKFLGLGKNESNEVVVTEIAVGADHGASFEASARAFVVAHVHNRHMAAGPEAADFEAQALLGRPFLVISADGEGVWEVAVLEGSRRYRQVTPTNGSWQSFQAEP